MYILFVNMDARNRFRDEFKKKIQLISSAFKHFIYHFDYPCHKLDVCVYKFTVSTREILWFCKYTYVCTNSSKCI